MRYERQALLPEIGEAGQARLARARVLIVGAGGLGSPAALYLAGAGVGTIGLIDDDCVSLNNLHRQVLYAEAAVGQPKAAAARRRLEALNGEVNIEAHNARLTADNVDELVARYDLIVDGCDNFATRYLLDASAERLGRPYVYGGVCEFDAQVSVFHAPGRPVGFSRLYPDRAALSAAPPPSKAIIGPVAGICASIQAAQAIALICGYEVALAGRLWWMNVKTMESGTLALQ